MTGTADFVMAWQFVALCWWWIIEHHIFWDSMAAGENISTMAAINRCSQTDTRTHKLTDVPKIGEQPASPHIMFVIIQCARKLTVFIFFYLCLHKLWYGSCCCCWLFLLFFFFFFAIIFWLVCKIFQEYMIIFFFRKALLSLNTLLIFFCLAYVSRGYVIVELWAQWGEI